MARKTRPACVRAVGQASRTLTSPRARATNTGCFTQRQGVFEQGSRRLGELAQSCLTGSRAAGRRACSG